MLKKISIASALLLFISFFAKSFAAIPISLDRSTTLAPMLANVTPSVVNIAVEKNPDAAGSNSPRTQEPGAQPPGAPPSAPPSPTQPGPNFEALGSGVIFDAKNGLIITNAHVIQDERIMLVTLKDGRRFKADLVGKDEGFDIAIIKIPPNNLKSINFGDSDQLKVGDFVAAIGSPFGFTQTVTSGVISALNREEPQIEGFQSFIQTDAPINPGNSGGALINMQGDLVGINTAMFTPTYGSIGIGFAIPSNMVKSVIEQLLKYGEVERGFLGVIAQDVTPELADALGIQPEQGVIITQVVSGSPAEKAGFKVEDIIEKLNGKVIRTSAQLRNNLGLMRPGTPITVNIIRDRSSKEISTKVGNPNTALKEQALPFIGGMRLQNFSELQPSGEMLQGVLVTDVTDTSPGALGGLQVGDVITNADERPIHSVDELKNIVSNKQKQLLLKVNRGESSLFLVIQPS